MRPQQIAAETDRLHGIVTAVDHLLHSLAIMAIALVGSIGIDVWDRYCDWLNQRRR